MSLDQLPNELLADICSFLDGPRSVSSLALTCRRLNEFTKRDAWKALLRGRFASKILLQDETNDPGKNGALRLSDARNAVHGLTTLYRNWDRKAFVARYLSPSDPTIDMSTWRATRWQKAPGQTMGYQPNIDSYDRLVGGEWASRREVLVWSAGTQILMRVKRTSSADRPGSRDITVSEQADSFNQPASWYTWKQPDSEEGRDDILAMSLFRPEQSSTGKDEIEDIVIGGDFGLSVLHANLTRGELQTFQYEVDDRGVSSISISPAKEPRIAASFNNNDIALYPALNQEQVDRPIASISNVSPVAQGSSRIKDSRFLSDTKLAVSLLGSYYPIQIFEVISTGLYPVPYRTIGNNELSWAGRAVSHGVPDSPGTIYALESLPSDVCGSNGNGDIFLSGAYDGVVRLHDLRSPRGYEIKFSDPTDDSPIFSLRSQGTERFIVGASQHSMLKVFDVRLSGNRAHESIPLSPVSSHSNGSHPSKWPASPYYPSKQPNTGWNLYTSPRSVRPRLQNSSVYSLSLPSPSSPFIYAGIEDAVIEFAFTSILDRHPDPIFTPTLSYSEQDSSIDVVKSWDPKGDVVNMGMYEWSDKSQGMGMQLVNQASVKRTAAYWDAKENNVSTQAEAGHMKVLDERWRVPPEEGERWTRGEEPGIPHRNRGNRGARGWQSGRGRRGGRGRGRGAATSVS